VLGVPILDARAQFRRPSRFRDVITVESSVAEWRSSTFRLEHRVFNKGELAVEGYEVRAWVAKDESHPSGIRTRPLPNEIKARFEG
jgi:4-hydroxybenzoyl-CoA thioesterase